MNHRPCQVSEISASGDKLHVVGVDIFVGKKLEADVAPTDVVTVPHVSNVEYRLVNIDDGYLNLLDNNDVPKDDVKVPEGDFAAQIEDDFAQGKDLIINVTDSMGEQAATSKRDATN